MSRLMRLSNRQVLGLLMLFAVVNTFVSVGVIGGKNFDDWLSGLTSNLATEMVGAVITFIMFEMIIGGRQEKEKKKWQREEEKERLIRDLRSKVPDIAIKAAEELKATGHLKFGILYEADLRNVYLQGADLQEGNLMYTNLEGANLSGANLEGANLGNANLQGANLSGANLSRTALDMANLQGANLEEANMYRARLFWANLQGVNLQKANLRRVDLEEANLQEADLRHVEFDKNTTLPDCSFHRLLRESSKIYWTPETDMRRFTDPEHPNFWRSGNPNSPAYEGKKQNDE